MFIEYLDRGFGIDPDATCIVRADGGLRLSHREFAELSHRVRSWAEAGHAEVSWSDS